MIHQTLKLISSISQQKKSAATDIQTTALEVTSRRSLLEQEREITGSNPRITPMLLKAYFLKNEIGIINYTAKINQSVKFIILIKLHDI